RQRFPRRLDPQFGAAADRRLSDIFEPLAVALEDDRIGDGTGLEPAEVPGDAEPTDVTATDGGVPARLDFAGLFVGRDTVVDDDIGPGRSADRTVEVAECRALVGGAATVVRGPTALDRREADRLGI